jgi:DNA repair protein RadC
MHCDCPEAREIQEAEQRKKNLAQSILSAKDAIDRLSDYCEEKEQEYHDETKELLKNCIDLLEDGIITKANIEFGSIKATIQLKKDIVKISFKYSDQATIEV